MKLTLTFIDKTEQQVTRLSGRVEELTLENNKLKTQVEILRDPITPSMRGNHIFKQLNCSDDLEFGKCRIRITKTRHYITV